MDESGISLSNILQSFNGPVNEEQAWAICYQVVKSIACSSSHEHSNQFRTLASPSDLLVQKDGSLTISRNSQECSEKKVRLTKISFLSFFLRKNLVVSCITWSSSLRSTWLRVRWTWRKVFGPFSWITHRTTDLGWLGNWAIFWWNSWRWGHRTWCGGRRT